MILLNIEFDRGTMEFLIKVLICFVGVLVITGNHGDASVDNFMLTNSKPLIEDNLKSGDAKSCHRPCKFNVKPKRCHYKFIIEPTIMDDGKVLLAINDTVPGPAIHVCANDIIIAEVANKIPEQEITIHWHGIEQRGTPWMDGVPMITQCPIGFGSTYKYAFRASAPGTYFYHAYSVSHQADGVYGALIVNQPSPLEPHSALYDYDRSAENTLLIAAVFPELLTANLKDLKQVLPTELTINGEADSYRIFVSEGFSYRLRLINAVPVECPLVVNIESHQLVVIATDGHPVKPMHGTNLMLYPGERMDAVLKADQPVNGYWIRVKGLGACAGLEARSPLVYSGFNYTSMLTGDSQASWADSQKSVEVQESVIYGQMLHSITDVLPKVAHDKEIYLGVDRNTVAFQDNDNDFRYISDAIPKKPFYPSQLTTRRGQVIQINGKNFLYPNSPILTQPKDMKPGIKCSVGEEKMHQEVQCMLTTEEKNNDVVDLVIINEGAGSNDSYTFHMHGYSMLVLATSQSSERQPMTREQFRNWDAEGKVQRNLINPPLKDTITVPNKGYTIVRLLLDNKGSWLLECRACGLSSLPAAILISVPELIPKSVTGTLPKCGNYRPPDVLLN